MAAALLLAGEGTLDLDKELFRSLHWLLSNVFFAPNQALGSEPLGLLLTNLSSTCTQRHLVPISEFGSLSVCSSRIMANLLHGNAIACSLAIYLCKNRKSLA